MENRIIKSTGVTAEGDVIKGYPVEHPDGTVYIVHYAYGTTPVFTVVERSSVAPCPE